MKVINTISIYEVDEEVVEINRPTLSIKSHWNYDDRVVIDISDISAGTKSVTVMAGQLIIATQNAQNHK